MDIYILRNHQQIGPFSNDATQTLLRQGTVSANDLAWRPGIPEWQPLGAVLNAVSALPPGDRPSPPPVPTRAAVERATALQTAFLNYFQISRPPGLSKEGAEELIAKATADPDNAEGLTRWNQDRLRMHPELFAAEIQAKKADRAQFYLEHCQSAGASYFSGVTKAHCQVLVAFLDVTFPRWDGREEEAVENYFFPAVAEKFPQLVNKPWRGRFVYREGLVAAGATRKNPTAKLARTPTSPATALLRGILLGLVILAVLYAIHRVS